MEHAEASARIADLALEPHRLLDLEADPTPDDRALLLHARGCPACGAELEAWRRTHEAVLMAAGSGDLETGHGRAAPAEDAPMEPPPSLRVAVSSIPRRSPRLLDPQGASPPPLAPDRQRDRSGRRGWQLPALAAVIVVGLVIGLGVLAVDRVQQADVARRQATDLADLSATVDRVLRDAGHASIALMAPDGTPSGTAAWSSGEIVVMTTALTPPGPGAEYRCWVERDGQRSPIGVMRFADGVGYWAGPLDRYGDLPLDGGGRLGVSLEAPGQAAGGAPVLVGELPG